MRCSKPSRTALWNEIQACIDRKSAGPQPARVTDEPGAALPNIPDHCGTSSRFSLSNFPDQVRFEGHRRAFNGSVDVKQKLGRET
jgi:hypothetical protein